MHELGVYPQERTHRPIMNTVHQGFQKLSYYRHTQIPPKLSPINNLNTMRLRAQPPIIVRDRGMVKQITNYSALTTKKQHA